MFFFDAEEVNKPVFGLINLFYIFYRVKNQKNSIGTKCTLQKFLFVTI